MRKKNGQKLFHLAILRSGLQITHLLLLSTIVVTYFLYLNLSPSIDSERKFIHLTVGCLGTIGLLSQIISKIVYNNLDNFPVSILSFYRLALTKTWFLMISNLVLLLCQCVILFFLIYRSNVIIFSDSDGIIKYRRSDSSSEFYSEIIPAKSGKEIRLPCGEIEYYFLFPNDSTSDTSVFVNVWRWNGSILYLPGNRNRIIGDQSEVDLPKESEHPNNSIKKNNAFSGVIFVVYGKNRIPIVNAMVCLPEMTECVKTDVNGRFLIHYDSKLENSLTMLTVEKHGFTKFESNIFLMNGESYEYILSKN